MHKLAALCVRRPVFATVLILSLVVVGYFAYLQLGVDRFPKVDFPTITITTTLTGAAPEEIETDITDKIEETVNTISGIDQLQSTSSEGVSQVIVQFVLEKNADVAAQEVRDRVNTILRDLPKDADPPIIQKFDPDSVPVLGIALSGPAPIRDITEFADKKLRRRLESINGVGQVLIVGGRPRQINVVVDTEKLSAMGLTTAQVVGALQTQIVRDQSDYIVAAVEAVKEHLILGSLFAALIVWFFLSSPKLKAAASLVAATLSVYILLFKFHDVGALLVPMRIAGVLVALA